jgi:cysteinyl-tRNA synthetase
MDALGALRPAIKGVVSDTAEPRATGYIGPMVAMIQTLIEGGHAYPKAGHVLFRVRSYKDYGALSGRSVDDMIAGARVEVAPFKEDPLDFVLWKPSSDHEPGWDSPWGRGRPGWHIECSAMSHELLGPSFDIHGGGLDLQFPHHENEIAQSRCAHPESDFAQIWMHNEMLLVEGKKMSKSLNNFFTVRDLLDQGVPGEVIRFVLLSTHYRKPMDWTKDKAVEAEQTLRSFAEVVFDKAATEVDEDVIASLASDLNTSFAITRLRALAKANQAGTLRATLEFLGVDLSRQLDLVGRTRTDETGWTDSYLGHVPRTQESDAIIHAALLRLQALREVKDWKAADALKAVMADAGLKVRSFQLHGAPTYEVEDDFDPSKLEAFK